MIEILLEKEREVINNSGCVRTFQLQKENWEPIAGSKWQMEVLLGNVILFHCIET